MKDYVSLGLKNKIPLYGNGFLTEGVLEALGNDAEGIKTTLHYSDDLPNDANSEFRDKYQKNSINFQMSIVFKAMMLGYFSSAP